LERDSTCLPIDTVPETDGLTKRVNNTFQQLLRYFCCDDGSDRRDMLPQVEFAYNAARALGIEQTPFHANLAFHKRSHMTCCSACGHQFQFRKTALAGGASAEALRGCARMPVGTYLNLHAVGDGKTHAVPRLAW
jgi:hypothetical protein